jgi:hypothetical protein
MGFVVIAPDGGFLEHGSFVRLGRWSREMWLGEAVLDTVLSADAVEIMQSIASFRAL